MPFESTNYLRWYGRQHLALRAGPAKEQSVLTDFEQYPYQAGASLNAAGINYQTLKAMQGMKRLKQLESLSPPSN
jgi:hypothetical protein